MTRIVYVVTLEQTANLGTTIFENETTAKLYAGELQHQGLKPLVVPRCMVCDTGTDFFFNAEQKCASFGHLWVYGFLEAWCDRCGEDKPTDLAERDKGE